MSGKVYSDIVEHLPVLEYYARHCRHVTEFGVRSGESTVALLKGLGNVDKTHRPKLVSYDINRSKEIDALMKSGLPAQWEFKVQDTSLHFDIEETDMLFVDTLHTYEQVKAELQHADRVRWFIIFHDTVSQGEHSLDIQGRRGILPAIRELLETGKWSLLEEYPNNNGLWVVGKKVPDGSQVPKTYQNRNQS